MECESLCSQQLPRAVWQTELGSSMTPDGLAVPKFPSRKIRICMFLCASLRLLFAVFALINQWHIAIGLDLGHYHSAKVLRIS